MTPCSECGNSFQLSLLATAYVFSMALAPSKDRALYHALFIVVLLHDALFACNLLYAICCGCQHRAVQCSTFFEFAIFISDKRFVLMLHYLCFSLGFVVPGPVQYCVSVRGIQLIIGEREYMPWRWNPRLVDAST